MLPWTVGGMMALTPEDVQAAQMERARLEALEMGGVSEPFIDPIAALTAGIGVPGVASKIGAAVADGAYGWAMEEAMPYVVPMVRGMARGMMDPFGTIAGTHE